MFSEWLSHQFTKNWGSVNNICIILSAIDAAGFKQITSFRKKHIFEKNAILTEGILLRSVLVLHIPLEVPCVLHCLVNFDTIV